MVYRRVLEWPQKSLSVKSSDFIFGQDDEIINDLIDTFNITGGYGLAAPQIGFQKRVIIINESLLAGDENLNSALLMINPNIDSFFNKSVYREACFSVQGVSIDIERYSNISVSWTNQAGDRLSKDFEGYSAACLQHEVDHLDGVLMVDRISPLRKKMILKKKSKKSLREKRAKADMKNDSKQNRPGFRILKKGKR